MDSSSAGPMNIRIGGPMTSIFQHPRYVAKLDDDNVPVKLGSGSYGDVILAIDQEHEDAKMVAVKVQQIDREQSKEVFKVEKEFLHKVKHVNIIKMLDVISNNHGSCGDEDLSSTMLVLEYCNKGDLKTLLEHTNGQGFPRLVVASYFKQVAEAVHYLHRRMILHRDLKPGNVLATLLPQHLVAQGHPEEQLFYTLKICDFGCAKQLSQPSEDEKKDKRRQTQRMRKSGVTSLFGSSAYLPPEGRFDIPDELLGERLLDAEDRQLSTTAYSPPESSNISQPSDQAPVRWYGFASDTFVLGLILFELWTGKVVAQVLGDGGIAEMLANDKAEKLLEDLTLAMEGKGVQKIKNRLKFQTDMVHLDPGLRKPLGNLLQRVWITKVAKREVQERKTEIIKVLMDSGQPICACRLSPESADPEEERTGRRSRSLARDRRSAVADQQKEKAGPARPKSTVSVRNKRSRAPRKTAF